jgi:hypothetical protein
MMDYPREMMWAQSRGLVMNTLSERERALAQQLASLIPGEHLRLKCPKCRRWRPVFWTERQFHGTDGKLAARCEIHGVYTVDDVVKGGD